MSQNQAMSKTLENYKKYELQDFLRSRGVSHTGSATGSSSQLWHFADFVTSLIIHKRTTHHEIMMGRKIISVITLMRILRQAPTWPSQELLGLCRAATTLNYGSANDKYRLDYESVTQPSSEPAARGRRATPASCSPTQLWPTSRTCRAEYPDLVHMLIRELVQRLSTTPLSCSAASTSPSTNTSRMTQDTFQEGILSNSVSNLLAFRNHPSRRPGLAGNYSMKTYKALTSF